MTRRFLTRPLEHLRTARGRLGASVLRLRTASLHVRMGVSVGGVLLLMLFVVACSKGAPAAVAIKTAQVEQKIEALVQTTESPTPTPTPTPSATPTPTTTTTSTPTSTPTPVATVKAAVSTPVPGKPAPNSASAGFAPPPAKYKD